MAREDESGFLKRWSRRKQSESEQEKGVETDGSAIPEAVPVEDPETAEARRLEQEDYVRNLPEPESLEYDADFTAFLKEGVPDELRSRALRQLWRSHPTLANLDGLIDYGGDYTDAALATGVIKTLYKVGRGMVPDEEPEQPEVPEVAVVDQESPKTQTERTEEVSPDLSEKPDSGKKIPAPDSDVRIPDGLVHPETARQTLKSETSEETEKDRKSQPAQASTQGGAPGSALARRWGHKG